jgi:HPt (histidine-containing phosphotransfer) domain-containing protein
MFRLLACSDLASDRIYFPSVESQQSRYHQMIFDQRAKTHKNVVRFCKRQVKGMAAPTEGVDASDFEAMVATYKTIAHHCEAAGMTRVSTAH